jgi:flagellar biosynthesis protein FliR/FlhB
LINTVYYMAVLLIFLRMLTFFAIVPVFFPNGTPNVMKIFLAGITAFILVPGVPALNIGAITSNYTLVIACGNEVINGLLLGFLTNLSFSIIRMAGQLIDTQMGFSMISLFDPSSSSNETLLEKLLYWTSLTLFFLVDGHHMLIRVLVEGFKIVGLGKSIIGQNTIMLIFNDFVQYFILGLKIAIPLVLIVIITDITLGLISRTVPALNVMILGLPIKILVGLACFTLALPEIASGIIHIFNTLPDAYKGIFNSGGAPLMFILASGEKTEDATPKKKRDARKKGQIARSKEVPLAVTLFGATIIIASLGGFIGNTIKATTMYFLNINPMHDFTYTSLLNLTSVIMLRSAVVIIPVLVPLMVIGVAANVMQVGFLFTGEPIIPKLSKLNPLSGFKKMFSMKSAITALKDIAVISVVGYVGYLFVKGEYPNIMLMGNLTISLIPGVFTGIILGILTRVTIVLIIIALLDYIYQRYSTSKDLRMTKQEVKEEYKQEEGDPQIKAKIRQRQREMSMKRMMQSIPTATVVVTNPTHLAVALRYEEGKDEAPTLIAKGSGYVAIRIKDIAKENEVPIIENKPLARLIFEEVELESEIPANMFQAVAEILALIYKMKLKKRK